MRTCKPSALIGRGTFDIQNPLAAKAARSHGAALVREVTKETKRAIASVVARSFKAGIPPRDLARVIRTLVGLTTAQANAVMTAQLGWMAAGVAPDIAAVRAAKYADKLLSKRAMTIARTESIRAANIGQQAAWARAADKGLIQAKRTRRQWNAGNDLRTCPICAALDNRIADIRGNYESGLFGPPAHPNCRCSQNLVFIK